MTRLATKFAVATAATAIMFAGAAPAIAAPQAPVAPVAESGSSGTGSSAIDIPLGLLKLILCGQWSNSTDPHPNPSCR
ncbi:hypothetical protein AB0H76_37270 [Nocardia sp. NPDC050712]|uniref:hypothetical protein n=1 Tax=Nocardia sp. NPDC050712 TaxID=3155518 RepID=UPI0033EC80CC